MEENLTDWWGHPTTGQYLGSDEYLVLVHLGHHNNITHSSHFLLRPLGSLGFKLGQQTVSLLFA